MSQNISPKTPVIDSEQSKSEQQVKTRQAFPLRIFTWMFSSIPTLLVMLLLAGVGFLGHHTEWKIPKFSEVSGAEIAQPDDWCEEHGVPESKCVACNPDLFPPPKDYGWCKIHGVHQCPLHHPEVAQLEKTPEIQQADIERAKRALALRPRPENNPSCSSYQNRIQFTSFETIKKTGIEVEIVKRESIVEQIQVMGEIRYDGTRLARLSSKSAGTVWRVEKQVGDQVKQGEILALIDAVGVGLAKTELLAALAKEHLQKKIHERLKGLKDVISERAVQESETKLSEARIRVLSAQQTLVNLGLPVNAEKLRGLSEKKLNDRIRFLGLPTSFVRQFNPQTTTSNLLPVRSPLNGIVVNREVVAGEVVNTSRLLFEVADTDKMWLMLNVPLEEARYVAIGQKVTFQVDGGEEEIRGVLDWMSTSADPKTRTIKVRASLTNYQRKLRNESFGSGQIILREEKDAIVVPNEAISWEGCCHVVYVRDKDYFKEGAPKLFHIRSVRPGVKNKTSTEIISGVLPGEVIVTKGRDVLQAQLLKSNLGEGCTCG
ncbi:Probable Co/Zn/Cd efflux system membrane fusion protein [hydrothermal vent metagenome]|uniref:Probable Co/Zn/Cd efflux system membrane fusion protein n=1 Tax=hydrothermal vent metagenome TaxID=652676 RepID=A0A3B1DX07_9ZZZZ